MFLFDVDFLTAYRAYHKATEPFPTPGLQQTSFGVADDNIITIEEKAYPLVA
jgi:hypothetical protein